jgi:hypothetical protein
VINIDENLKMIGDITNDVDNVNFLRNIIDDDIETASGIDNNISKSTCNEEHFDEVGQFSASNLSNEDLLKATNITTETLHMDIAKLFKFDNYTAIPTYSELQSGELGAKLFINQTSRYTILDAVIFFNGLLQRYPTTPMDVFDAIAKWIHYMTASSNMPESLSTLNECITTVDHLIEVPHCANSKCGHIFDPSIDELQVSLAE